VKVKVKVRPISLVPGETYVLTCDHILSSKALNYLREYYKEIGDLHGVDFIILDNGLSISQEVTISFLDLVNKVLDFFNKR